VPIINHWILQTVKTVVLANPLKEAKNNYSMIVSLIIFLKIIKLLNIFFICLGLNVPQKLTNNVGNLSPEINLPLLTHASVVLGENSVSYRHSKTVTLPVQLPIKEPKETIEDPMTCVETSEIPCSIPVPPPNNKAQDSPPIVQLSSSHVSLYKPTDDPC